MNLNSFTNTVKLLTLPTSTPNVVPIQLNKNIYSKTK